MANARSLAVLAAALILAAPPAGAETPDVLRLSYDVWQGGLRALTLTTTSTGAMTGNGSDQATEYRALVSAETSGLVGWLYPYAVRAKSEGQTRQAAVTPRYFETTSDKAGRLKTRAITYREFGAPDVRHDPPRDGKDAMAETLLRDTLDPLSAVIAAIQRFARRGRCAGRVPVFDGKRRYDLVIKPLGETVLAPSRYGTYSGPATLCNVAVKPLAGFKKRWRMGSRVPIKVDVWLAPLFEQGPALPVRVEGENGLGHLVVHLVDVQSQVVAKKASR